MRSLAAVIVLVAVVLVGCASDDTPAAVRSAYEPLVEDPLWTATPPGYEEVSAWGVKCLSNDTGGRDERDLERLL